LLFVEFLQIGLNILVMWVIYMEKILMDLGLNGKEIKIYLKLLEYGQSSIQKIFELTGINRVSLYDILKSMVGKSFVNEIYIGKIKNYNAVQPSFILNIIKEKEKKFKEVLPDFEKLVQSNVCVPKVKIFEGKEGLNVITEDILSEDNDEVCSYGSYELMLEIRKYQLIDYMKQRMRNKIKSKVITDSSFLKHNFQNKDEYGGLTKFKIDDCFKDIKSWHYVYGGKFVTISCDEDNFIGIIVEDLTIAETQKFVFDKL